MTQQDEKRLALEARIARQLVSDALALGYRISVYDGEEWCLCKSANKATIMGAMFSTDSDTLRAFGPDGKSVGSVMFVWGNDTDCLADHTANPATEAWVAGAEALAERLDK